MKMMGISMYGDAEALKNATGGEEIYIDDENGWTVYTRDGKPSAQWEVQVVVTEEGCEVLSW